MVRDTACALKGHHIHRFTFNLRHTMHFLQIENPSKIFAQVHLRSIPCILKKCITWTDTCVVIIIAVVIYFVLSFWVAVL